MNGTDLLLDRAAHRVRYVKPVPRRQARGLVAEVYQQAASEFQLAPPLTLHSSSPRLLAAVWLATREALVVGGGRLVKEAVAVGVSDANRCPFCVDVHEVMLGTANPREESALHSVRDWARATLMPDSEQIRAIPVTVASPTAMRATAVAFHYINRVVSLFLPESPLDRPAGLAVLRGPVAWLAARTVGRATVAKAPAPGRQLALFHADAPPSGVPWIDESPTIGPAMQALFHEAGQAARSIVDPMVIDRVEQGMAQWRGQTAPLGRHWVTEGLGDPDLGTVPAARLALLVARAPDRIVPDDVAEFRANHPEDSSLVAVASWGAALAARQVATWLQPIPGPTSTTPAI